ncbi:hypothetical protein BDW59DRAFT_174142 [Aspergillus cavernicola]|uniref:HNH nuclease domain-containing protein n=1 Tax=Aspergillus cavernicola TaxID=176166 RepID=A0ABR4I271_9EURO
MAAGEMCFMCDLEADHCAHVIAEADKSIQTLSERGLINFDLMSPMNGVALCASCHIRYDNHCDPRLIFYPKDIDFFIAFELRNRIRRRKDGSSRTVPTAAQYAKRGGLYTRIVFRRKGQDTAIVKDPACWHGAPLGSLRRVFGIMGCPRADGIPEEDMLRLRDLWDLYFRDNEGLAQTVATRYGFSATEEDFGLGGVDSDNDEPGVPGEDSEIVKRDEEEDEEEEEDGSLRKRRAPAGTWQQPKPVPFNYRNWCWEYGPRSSSNQKAETFTLHGPTSFVRNP